MPSGTPIDAVWKRRRSLDRRSYLRPMTASQMVDFSLLVYRHLAWPMVRATAPSAMVTYIGLVQLFAFVGPAVFTTRYPTNPQLQLTEMVVTLAVGAFVAIPLCLVGLNYPLGFASVLAGQAIRGDLPDEAEARKAAEKSFWKRFFTMGPVMFATFGPILGSIVLIGASSTLEKLFGESSFVSMAAGILVLVGFVVALVFVPLGLSVGAFAIPAQVWEVLSPRQAYRRSVTLRKSYPVHGSSGNTLLVMALIGLLSFVALDGTLALLAATVTSFPGLEGFLARGFAGAVVKGAIEALPAYLALLFVLPFVTTCVTVMYFERRVRLEAYDIEVMVGDLKGGQRAEG